MAKDNQPTLPGMENLGSTKKPRKPRKPKGQLSMAMHLDGLNSALKENRFKNGFETNTGIGDGDPMYKGARAQAEEDLFGAHQGLILDKDRPIYGVLRHHDDKFPVNDEYGDALVDIKWPKRGQRVTTTPDDSLNLHVNALGKDIYSNLSNSQFGEHIDKVVKSVEPLSTKHAPTSWKEDGDSEYREVQWHDKPKPQSDIEAVNLTDDLGHYRNRDYGVGSINLGEKINRFVERHKAHAESMRAAGLSKDAPVKSEINYSEYQPSLFEKGDEPEFKGRNVSFSEKRTF